MFNAIPGCISYFCIRPIWQVILIDRVSSPPSCFADRSAISGVSHGFRWSILSRAQAVAWTRRILRHHRLGKGCEFASSGWRKKWSWFNFHLEDESRKPTSVSFHFCTFARSISKSPFVRGDFSVEHLYMNFPSIVCLRSIRRLSSSNCICLWQIRMNERSTAKANIWLSHRHSSADFFMSRCHRQRLQFRWIKMILFNSFILISSYETYFLAANIRLPRWQPLVSAVWVSLSRKSYWKEQTKNGIIAWMGKWYVEITMVAPTGWTIAVWVSRVAKFVSFMFSSSGPVCVNALWYSRAAEPITNQWTIKYWMFRPSLTRFLIHESAHKWFHNRDIDYLDDNSF